MATDRSGTVSERARLYRALGDETRLRIVDALQLGDRTPKELGALAGVPANLLAFHLNVLDQAGVIARARSQGDARRRYVRLRRDRPRALAAPPALDHTADRVVFVCTGNAARSPLAAGLWRARTGRPALSAGLAPAARVHPRAVSIARRRGLDLGAARPLGYAELTVEPDLVVSVCDRAREAPMAFSAPLLHWSVPDPAGEDGAAFEQVCDDLADRVDRLARSVATA